MRSQKCLSCRANGSPGSGMAHPRRKWPMPGWRPIGHHETHVRDAERPLRTGYHVAVSVRVLRETRGPRPPSSPSSSATPPHPTAASIPPLRWRTPSPRPRFPPLAIGGRVLDAMAWTRTTSPTRARSTSRSWMRLIKTRPPSGSRRHGAASKYSRGFANIVVASTATTWTETSFRDDAPRGSHERAVTPMMAHQQWDPCPLSGAGQPKAIRDGRGNRLLDEHRDPSLDALQGLGHMHRSRGRDDRSVRALAIEKLLQR